MEELWKKVLAEIELEISKSIFLAFFKSSELISLEDSMAIIGTTSEMHTNYIKTRYTDLIKKLILKHGGKEVSIEFVSGIRKEVSTPKGADPGPLFVQDLKSQPAITRPLPRIRTDYTFDNLAVSESSNQLAYTAALTVANNPGDKYNPLFFYGTVGVGKTHLMHSIANRVYEHNPHVNVLYLSTEEFTNEIVEAIQRKSTTQMRKKFRNVDLSLLDDIQFLSGKEKVQEELFHTFNTLIDKKSQIVFSSDRPPSELKKVEARLVSRFEGGLTVDIQPPDFEMRTAILLIKSKKYGLDLDYDGAALIAEGVHNTRGLEGILLKISSLALAQNVTKIPASLVQQALGARPKQSQNTLHPDDIINLVCDYYGLKPKHLKGSKRDAMLVKPRHACMYLLKEDLGLTYVEIGNLLGGRDHTTVMHGVEKMKTLLENTPKIKEDIVYIKQKIQDDFMS